MKTFAWILLTLFTVLKSQAQDVQVTLVDPCASIDKKSTIIINDNTLTTNSLARTTTDNNTFNFTLTTSVNTSAGVYNTSGNLVRTLWNGVRYEAGDYKAVWSGVLDDGTQAPPGIYQAKVLTNNVQYTWEGVIGNTSSSWTDNVFKSYGGNTCFAFVGTKGFYGQFFYEGGTNSKYFNTTDIGSSYDVNFGVHAITIDCATDGTNIYWIGADQYQNNGTNGNQSNYIYACKASDNTAVSFTNETTHNSGRENESYPHFIGWANEANFISYTGIAVNRNFIFVTKSTGQLFIFNKATGAIVQTLTYTNPGKLAAGTNNELWMIVNGICKKFTVNTGTGTLMDLGISLAATNPACVRISPDNSTVLISDAGTHQIKAYSNSNGSLLWTLGQQGGYDTNGPAVANDKFMFNRVNFASPAVAYQPDGSFWVNDVGNYRSLHFNADRTYKEQIAYMPASRSTNADPNVQTRIFGDELEFQRDYSKPLDNGVNGSWKLIKNWKVGTNLDVFAKFRQVITFPNGKTYASGSTNNRLYWLSDQGAIDVGSIQDQCTLQADGSLYQRISYDSSTLTVQKATLTGYSSNGMPTWGPFAFVVKTPAYTQNSPFFFYNPTNVKGSSTNTAKEFFFNPWQGTVANVNTGYGYHLGAVKTGNSTWDWQASKSTFYDYHGDYPRNGDFDIGNNDLQPQHSENCQALVNGSNIFWNVNGEFWKANTVGGQINIWNHFNEDGLLIGNFGKTGLDAALTGNTGYAGNAFSTALIKVGNDFYIYHCDESQHGGVHSWRVTGLNTIQEQTFPITVSAANMSINDPSNLMSGLPYKSTTFTGGNGFSVSYPAGLVLKTNTVEYQKDNIDIALGGNGNLLILKSLNNVSNLTTWQLIAGIGYQNGEYTFGNAPDGSDNYNYLEVLDTSGKIIARFIGNEADTRNNYYLRIWINNTIVAQGSTVNGLNNYYFRDISFSYANGAIIFKHQDYPTVTVTTPFEAGAKMGAPAYLRVNQGGNRTRYIYLNKLRFTGN